MSGSTKTACANIPEPVRLGFSDLILAAPPSRCSDRTAIRGKDRCAISILVSPSPMPSVPYPITALIPAGAEGSYDFTLVVEQGSKRASRMFSFIVE